MMAPMTETPEPQAGPTAARVTLPQPKPSRLYQAAAWVVIITGIVVTTAVIFFSGAILTHQGGHHHHHHGHPPCKMMDRDGGDRGR